MKNRIKKLLMLIPSAFLVLSMLWVILYSAVPVTWTPLMLKRCVQNIGEKGYRNTRTWVDIENISPVMVRAVIASEDGRFMEHWGFDIKELIKMKREHEKTGKKIRGCSTISQQVAKNCFTFCSRSLSRKLIEAYYTVLIELIWGKERILEVYLNVAETGRGLFGVEAACQRYYSCPTSDLTVSDAAALACVLPKPLTRTPKVVMSIHSDKHLRLSKEVGKAGFK
jgi:monofunctional biosynthetic peptidoglycan transglycosylase